MLWLSLICLTLFPISSISIIFSLLLLYKQHCNKWSYLFTITHVNISIGQILCKEIELHGQRGCAFIIWWIALLEGCTDLYFYVQHMRITVSHTFARIVCYKTFRSFSICQVKKMVSHFSLMSMLNIFFLFFLFFWFKSHFLFFFPMTCHLYHLFIFMVNCLFLKGL